MKKLIIISLMMVACGEQMTCNNPTFWADDHVCVVDEDGVLGNLAVSRELFIDVIIRTDLQIKKEVKNSDMQTEIILSAKPLESGSFGTCQPNPTYDEFQIVVTVQDGKERFLRTVVHEMMHVGLLSTGLDMEHNRASMWIDTCHTTDGCDVFSTLEDRLWSEAINTINL